MTVRRFGKLSGLFALAAASCLFRVWVALAQSENQSWVSNDQQGDPSGTINPTRTSNTHSEIGGRILEKTSLERLGLDGRYVPYSDTERESIRINDTTVRNVERTFGRDADGRRVLIQETQEESRKLPSGEVSVGRTILNPDVNGGMQVIRRELEDSKLLDPSVRLTRTTVLAPDVNGVFSAVVQTEERETRRNDGTVESKKSTLLSDGTGGWKLGELRESTSKEEGQVQNKEEHVLRPDSNGNLKLVERTVKQQGRTESGEQRDTVVTYSTSVPGVAGDASLQLVRRETTVRRSTSAGAESTIRQVEQPPPGSPSDGLHVTEQAVDIVRPDSNGIAHGTGTIFTPDSDGQLRQVWIDIGKTGNPSAVQVDTGSSKPK
jgi:hypothetical protein